MPKMEANLEQSISQYLDKVLPKKLEEIEANKTPSMAIIATKGTLDCGLPAVYPRLHRLGSRLGCFDFLHLLWPAASEEGHRR